LLVILTLLAASVFAYAPVARQPFVRFDDPTYVFENPAINQGLTRGSLQTAFTIIHGGNWHPLTTLSHMLDVQLFGIHAAPMKIENVVLHLLATLLLYTLIGKTTRHWTAAAITAGLFCIHPTRVESVAWVSERKDVLSAVFFMLCLHAYVWHARRPSIPRLGATALLLMLGLMSKPMLVTLPAVCALLDFWPLKRLRRNVIETAVDTDASYPAVSMRRAVIEKLVLAVPVLVSALLTLRAQHASGAVAGLADYPPGVRTANAVVSVLRYLGLLVWPVGLSPMYPYPLAWPVGLVVVSTLVLVGASAIALLAWKRRPWVTVGWLWFVGTLVPVIGLLQVGRQSMADRYTYLTFIGLFLIIGMTVERLTKRVQRVYVVTTCALVLGVLTLRTRDQVLLWNGTEKLFTHAVRVTGGDVLMYDMLGSEYARQNNVETARDCFRKALELGPEYANVSYNWANLELLQNNPKRAIELYELSLARDKSAAAVWSNYAAALTAVDRLDDALTAANKAVFIDAKFYEARVTRGKIHELQHRADDAASDYRAALEINPRSDLAKRGLSRLRQTGG